jgi:GNAT superfamily N-acetyltransferase
MTRMLSARITHLEMAARPLHRVPAPMGAQLAVMRAPSMPLHFYRYLYEKVGKPHHWEVRRRMDDDALAAIIHATTTLIDVLYVDGAPAGFVEIDLSQAPEKAEIEYFGLMREFQGRGLSKFFLSCAIHAAWQHDPRALVIQTNSLDSPRALQLYQKMGFAAVGTSQIEIEAWD